jgi:SsrA-binding protein
LGFFFLESAQLYRYLCAAKIPALASVNKPKFANISNRRARYEYEFIDTYEAGIMLQGTEVKALRAGEANVSDAYCFFKKGELFIRNLYIKEYLHGSDANHDPKRERKLLLRRRELKKLEKKIKEKGLTIVPTKVFMTDRGLVKIEIALARGKNTYDKRDSLKKKDQRRDLDRLMK